MIIEIESNTFTFPKATKMIELDVPGNTPAKKNGKRIVFNRKTLKPFMISSLRHENWLEHALIATQKPRGKEFPLPSVQSLVCVFKRDSERKYDVDNTVASIADLLKEMGYLVDDNNKVVPVMIGVHGGVDKKTPRARVYLLY